MTDPLENHGASSSTASIGIIGLQLPFEMPDIRPIHCPRYDRLAKSYGELPKGAYSSALNPMSVGSFICMGSWNLATGPNLRKLHSRYGRLFSRRSAAPKCSRCRRIDLRAFMLQSTSLKKSENSSLNEVMA